MDIADLSGFDEGTTFEVDLVIIGGGPAGLTVARELMGAPIRVLVLESGLARETPEHASLAAVESIGQPSSAAQQAQRTFFHGPQAAFWSANEQPYGIRCRVLGGSSVAWAGKSAAFDAIDFQPRGWVPNSGWPMSRDSLDDYLDRAAELLNLGPNRYDESLWPVAGLSPRQPEIGAGRLRSFFWQFARSRLDPFSIMDFGKEFATYVNGNVRVLVNATVTSIGLSPDGERFQDLAVTSIEGRRATVKARMAVVAASGIENARLLLASRSVHSQGIGNGRDLVGRYLMDHVGARVAQFESADVKTVNRRFGFVGVRHKGRTQMYMHGLAPLPEYQQETTLLNSAVYFMPKRAPDNPWDALSRLIKRTSAAPLADSWTMLKGSGLLARGMAAKLVQSGAMPSVLTSVIVNTAIRLSPNTVAEEFQTGGVPHKLTAMSIDAISEQWPDPESRITLSERVDRFGVPIARVNWRIHAEERHTLAELARSTRAAFSASGMPVPHLESWIEKDRPDEAVIIDMGHTLGTTRMSEDPSRGVVTPDCQVHGIKGLYVAGGSVFPTSGHANPTLMIVALAIRLADNIRREFAVA